METKEIIYFDEPGPADPLIRTSGSFIKGPSIPNISRHIGAFCEEGGVIKKNGVTQIFGIFHDRCAQPHL
jgi:hypothetical protein